MLISGRLPKQREVIVPLDVPLAQIEVVSSVRGTVLLSSLRTLQDHNLLDRYYEALPRELHHEMRTLVGVSWVPAEVGIAHYRACTALGLSGPEQVQLGRASGARTNQTLAGSIMNLAKQVGVTPWSALAAFGRIHKRVLIGGGVSVVQVGPKDAIIEIYKVPVFDMDYLRNAYCGVVQGMCDHFCRRSYMKVVESSPARTAFELSWA